LSSSISWNNLLSSIAAILDTDDGITMAMKSCHAALWHVPCASCHREEQRQR
jgi:hypothetical protein